MAQDKLSSFGFRSVFLQCWGTFPVSLLPSHYNKGNSAFGIFSQFEKAAIVSILVKYQLLGLFVLFYTVWWWLAYLGVAVYIWNWCWVERYTPLLLCTRTLPKLLCLDHKMLRQTISSGQLKHNYCLLRLCCRQTLEIHLRTLRLAAYILGL